jgi:hypothetical protein
VSEASKDDPILDGDGEGEIDPFDTRSVLRWVSREKSKPKGKVNWEPLFEWLAKLRLSERDQHASFFNTLSCLQQAIKSGEFDQVDEQGRGLTGDLEIEGADYLYDHNRKVERGAEAG